jgi:hypothetical protein
MRLDEQRKTDYKKRFHGAMGSFFECKCVA